MAKVDIHNANVRLQIFELGTRRVKIRLEIWFVKPFSTSKEIPEKAYPKDILPL